MEPGSELYLQQVYTSLTQELSNNAAINPSMLSPYINPSNIDSLVEMEMQRIRQNCHAKEQQYVDQMLHENPITIDRRPSYNHHQLQQQQQQQMEEQEYNYGQQQDMQQQHQQQQRAEACRRSRFNNKIKKAKSKYRHKFISQKLIQTSQMFECIQDLIAKAECHVLNQGVSIDKLERMRRTYGIDRALNHVQDLDDIMPGEHDLN